MIQRRRKRRRRRRRRRRCWSRRRGGERVRLGGVRKAWRGPLGGRGELEELEEERRTERFGDEEGVGEAKQRRSLYHGEERHGRIGV
jgi:hypothetical protein